MKFKAFVLVLLLTVGLLAGCSTDKVPEEKETQKEEATVEKEETPDVVTTASLVDNEVAFEKAISKDGTWIVAILNNLKTDKELVVEGEFRDKDDAKSDLYRKLAFYAQDEARNVTARYTLTAPSMTIKSPNTNIVNGTFVGDVYVESDGFTLVDATIDGNLYFATEKNKSTFINEKESKITGTTEVKAK